MRGSQWPSSSVGKTAGAVRSSIDRVTHGESSEMYSQTRCRVQVSHWEAAWGGNCLKTSALCRMETRRRAYASRKS